MNRCSLLLFAVVLSGAVACVPSAPPASEVGEHTRSRSLPGSHATPVHGFVLNSH